MRRATVRHIAPWLFTRWWLGEHWFDAVMCDGPFPRLCPTAERPTIAFPLPLEPVG